ncbi:hypothetical protein TNCV_117821 [Trichonephila clavipes]|nr:hypothetical protein TNCV_117821 [Trichonephila clavipes]
MQFPPPLPSTEQEQTKWGLGGGYFLSRFQKLIPVGWSHDSFAHMQATWGGWEAREMRVRAVTVSDEGDVSDYLLSAF